MTAHHGLVFYEASHRYRLDGAWAVDERGVSLYLPDPTGLTNGVTVALEPSQVEDIYLAMRAAQLGADTRGDL